MSSGCLLPRRRRQELPGTIAPTWTPWPVVDECGVEEALQAEIDRIRRHVKGLNGQQTAHSHAYAYDGLGQLVRYQDPDQF
ncbi:MAG: hypothetical protein IT457_24690, partial [Planctomycetes bacterium]|nr:hypothetical protein [Planctomycetota bacterium]